MPRRGIVSPLTRRILTINVLALAVLLAGLLYVGRYEENLIEAEFQALRTQGEIFAGALGEGAHGTLSDGTTALRPEIAGPMLRRLVLPTRTTRARLFGVDGSVLADSRILLGPEGAPVQVVALPPPVEEEGLSRFVVHLYDWVVSLLPGRRHLPRYVERTEQRATDYAEVEKALAGDVAKGLRVGEASGLVLTVAVPVQRFKQVIGAILLSIRGGAIDDAVRAVRFDILKVFGLALAVTVLLSLYLARSIVRPLHRLAEAADRVRRAPGRERSIPDFHDRQDEIGALARDLKAMTDALGVRLDAIESFAADVAHEIKNPLTSLRSAVETAARLTDPDQQKKLMGIILDDVQRLDRLITDISDASRLDTELSRAELAELELDRLLAALVEVYRTARTGAGYTLIFEPVTAGPFRVLGVESRLVQVFQNLLTNAFSFSPSGGAVTVRIRRDGDWVVATVEDEGPGIPDGSLSRIFERFYSERPEAERFGTHSGLGLSISRQIVEAHNGHIRAENRRDGNGRVQGARFVVSLPAA